MLTGHCFPVIVDLVLMLVWFHNKNKEFYVFY